MATKEALSVRPFSYLTLGIGSGLFFSYYDWWRRCALDEIMNNQKEREYHYTLRALHRVRVGEEDEISNLTEYLKSRTTNL